MRKLYSFDSDGYIKCCVYKITNLINGKIYIGKTIREARFRWASHISPKADKSLLIVRSLKKYGYTNFSFEVIDITETEEQLLEKEAFYIEYHESLAPDGYNQIDGRGNYSEKIAEKIKNSSAKGFLKTEVTRNDGKVFESIHAAATASGTNSPNIVSQIKGARRLCNGYQFRYGRQPSWDIQTPIWKTAKKVIREDGLVFDSMILAGVFECVTKERISAAVRMKRKINGFYYNYYTGEV